MKSLLIAGLMLGSSVFAPALSAADCPFGAAGVGEGLANTLFTSGKYNPGKLLNPRTFKDAWKVFGTDKDFWDARDPWEYVKLNDWQIVEVEQFQREADVLSNCMGGSYGVNLFDGVTLPKEMGEWARSAEELAQMYQDARDLVEAIKNFDPKKNAREFAEDYIQQKVAETLANSKDPTLLALYQDVQEFSDLAKEFDPIPVPSFKLRDDLDSQTHKTWKAAFGKPENAYAEINAAFDIRSRGSEAQVGAKARAFMKFFKSQDFTIADINLHAEVSNKKGFDAGGTIWIVGKDLSPGVIKGSTNFEIRKDSDPIKLVDVFQKFWFMIGPIPVSAKFGASGTVAFGYNLGAAGLTAGLGVGPTIQAGAYGEAAVDIVVVRVGVGGILRIIDATANLRAFAAVNFRDDGTPYLTNGLDTKTTLTLLSGKIYGFAEVGLPPPLYQYWEKSFYEFQGIRKPEPGLAVNFEKKTEDGKVTVAGQADNEDYEAATLDNQVTKVVDEFTNELLASGPEIDAATNSANAVLYSLEQNAFGPAMTAIENWRIVQ